MRQLAEQLTSERIVSKILNYRSAIGERVCLPELAFARRRESLQQRRLDRVLPRRVHDSFMAEDGIRLRASRKHNAPQADTPHLLVRLLGIAKVTGSNSRNAKLLPARVDSNLPTPSSVSIARKPRKYPTLVACEQSTESIAARSAGTTRLARDPAAHTESRDQDSRRSGSPCTANSPAA